MVVGIFHPVTFLVADSLQHLWLGALLPVGCLGAIPPTNSLNRVRLERGNMGNTISFPVAYLALPDLQGRPTGWNEFPLLVPYNLINL
jgi:hypothetical protein